MLYTNPASQWKLKKPTNFSRGSVIFCDYNIQLVLSSFLSGLPDSKANFAFAPPLPTSMHPTPQYLLEKQPCPPTQWKCMPAGGIWRPHLDLVHRVLWTTSCPLQSVGTNHHPTSEGASPPPFLQPISPLPRTQLKYLGVLSIFLLLDAPPCCCSLYISLTRNAAPRSHLVACWKPCCSVPGTAYVTREGHIYNPNIMEVRGRSIQSSRSSSTIKLIRGQPGVEKTVLKN